MVAITALTGGHAMRLHAGGSAARASAPDAGQEARRDAPATIVDLSDQARQLMAEAKAANAALEVFAIASGATPAPEDKPQTLIAHDLRSNEGLYLVVTAEG